MPWPRSLTPGCAPMLSDMADEMRLYERSALKDFRVSILDRVELDPELATLQVCCRIRLRGGSLASPRGSVTIRAIVAHTLAKVA
jgi:hypothetical protein